MKRWFEAIKARPTTISAYKKAEQFKDKTLDPNKSRDMLVSKYSSALIRG